MNDQKLTFRVKAGYGVCDLGGGLFFTVIGLWLMKYLTDTVGIEAGLAGIIVAIGKVWDAITDPVTGYLSDRTKSRWGRRRPWILFGSFPLFIAMIIMFTNPGIEDKTLLFFWGIFAFCLLNTVYTAVNVPYSSLTPELTQDYNERSTLNGYRFGFGVIGTLIGAGAVLPVIGIFTSRSIGYSVVGTIFGAIMMITALITFFSVREPSTVRPLVTEGFFRTYRKVFKNKPFILLLLAFAFHITALTIVMSISVYYFAYIHNDESMTTPAMLILLVTVFAVIPVSVIAAKKVGKKIVYGSGMLILTAALVVIFFFGHITPIGFSLAMMFFAGIGLGFIYAMPYAMIPDTVEYDYLKTGERTEGAFYGIWTFGIKIGHAIALVITGAVLSFSGYIPNVAQTITARVGIRFLIGPVAAFIFLISIIILYFYPINEEKYNEILEGIKEMEAEE